MTLDASCCMQWQKRRLDPLSHVLSAESHHYILQVGHDLAILVKRSLQCIEDA